ncbi:MAG: M64 family metallopeptidase [Pseudomonadota bacterium]
MVLRVSASVLIRRVFAAALLFAGLAGTEANAAPTHYIFLEVDNSPTRQDAPTVAFYQLLDLPARPARSLPARRWRNVLTAVDRDGQTVAVESTAVHHSPASTTAILLRIPEAAQDVHVQHWDAAGTRRGSWSLQELIDGAKRTVPMAKGSPAIDEAPLNRVNLLMLSEGYQASEEAKFEADVARALEGFLSIEPYRSYRSFLTIESYFVASAESGADHPGCFDTDPLAPLAVDTAFDATFCTAGFDRLLTVNDAAVAQAAAGAPFFWDRAVVVVNDSRYGGSGGFFPVISTHPLSPELLIHEWGHSFSRLTDEYETEAQVFPCSDEDLSLPPCEPNATDVVDRDRIKWRNWIEPTTAIPTPPTFGNRGLVGLFEGARYQSRGMYRPVNQCAMRALGQEFCPVCAETYVATLYDGGWGLPAAGVSVIEPGTANPTNDIPVDTTVGETLTLSAQLVAPAHGVETLWKVDGVPATEQAMQAAPTAGDPPLVSSFDFRPGARGRYELTLEVIDRSPFLAGALNAPQRLFRQQWIVEAGGLAISGLWFDPASEGDGFNVIQTDDTLTVFYFGYDANGQRLWLVSESTAEPVDPGVPLTLDMLSAGSGSFQQPGAPESLVSWGSLTLEFTDCGQATFGLDGADGQKTFQAVRLASVPPAEC